MGILFAVLAVAAESSAKTFDKLNYRKNHIAVSQSIFLTFLVMTASLLAYTLITQQPLPQITTYSLGLLGLIALVSFVGNVFDEQSLKINDLSLREPLMNFQPVLAGFIAYLVFPEERKPVALVAFVLAIFIVNWGTSRRRLHISEKKGMFLLLLAVIFYSILPILYKFALEHVSPEYIGLTRTAAILLLTIIFFKPFKYVYTTKQIQYGSIAGVIYAAGTLFSLYSIDILGVVQTMLLTLLGPSLIYLSSHFILKEKIKRGEVLSSCLLAGVVLIALFA